MKKSFFRIIVVVFLVCALLVSWSPIQVKANTLAMAGSAILNFFEAGAAAAGMSVFSYVAIGLGLTLGAAKLADVVGEYIEYSGNLGAKIYYYPDGSWTYGVDLGFIDSVRAFLFDAGYLVDTGNLTTVVPEGQTYRTYTANAPCVAFMYSYSYYVASRSQYYFAKLGYLVCSVPNYQFTANGNKATTTVKSNDNTYYAYCIYQGAQYLTKAELTVAMSEPSDFYYVGDCGTTYTLSRVLQNYGWGGIQGAGDAVTDYVAPLDVALDEAYPEWYGNSRPYVTPGTEEEVAVLPIPYNPTADPDAAPGVLTQPDIWQGSIADPMPGIGTVPDVSIAETPWVAVKKWVSDFFIPSGDITMYSLDLTELFPFCIPFDLFDLLSALRADPVAPVFELELDFGITKAPIVVDLSGWSDLASIVRILEIGLFCIGLALGTKELIAS